MAIQPTKLEFEDFMAAPASPEPQETPITVADLARARAEGATEARAKFNTEGIAALRSVAAAIEACSMAASEPVEKELFRLRELTGEFLETFCTGLMAEREIELAETLVSQLLNASQDESATILALAPQSVADHGERLMEILAGRGADKFITIEADDALAPGECRLSWRGGSIQRTRREIAAAVAEIFGAETGLESR